MIPLLAPQKILERKGKALIFTGRVVGGIEESIYSEREGRIKDLSADKSPCHDTSPLVGEGSIVGMKVVLIKLLLD